MTCSTCYERVINLLITKFELDILIEFLTRQCVQFVNTYRRPLKRWTCPGKLYGVRLTNCGNVVHIIQTIPI